MFNDQGIPNFSAETQDEHCIDANFAIACGDKFTRNDNFLVGLAQVESITG